MKLQGGSVVQIVVAASLLVGGGVYFYSEAPINIEDSNTDSQVIIQTTNIPLNVKNPVTPTPQNASQPTPLTKYNDGMVNECVDTYQSEQEKYNNQFGLGYIVVGFPSATSLTSAKEIIKSHTLIPRETNVGYHFYLYADVVVGQEFVWACRLKQDPRIRYADPAPTATAQ